MDLLSLKLRLAERRARAHVMDARGLRGVDLEDDLYDRVEQAAQPLLAELARRTRPAGGRATPLPLVARTLSIDTIDRLVRASLAPAVIVPEGLERDVAAPDVLRPRALPPDAPRPDEPKDPAAPTGPFASWEGDDYAALQHLVQPLVRATLEALRPPRDPSPSAPSDPEFWEGLYRRGGDGWELGRPAPPLARHFAAHPPRGLLALSPGCGRGHEARLLAGLGADVIAVDLADAAIEAARAIPLEAVAGAKPGRLEFRARDLFELPRDKERYDLVVEHTCFCAIDPARRPDYARVMGELLVRGGALVALFWAHARPGGPPFAATDDELRALFAPDFAVEEWTVPPDSVAARAGEERLVRLRRR